MRSLSATGGFVYVNGERIEMVVDGVGGFAVGEGQGIGVLAQAGGGVAVAEAGLGLEDLAAANQEAGDVVAQPMQ